VNNPLKKDLFHDICKLIPERKRLVKLIVLNNNLTSNEMWCAILDLCLLYARDSTVLYLPHLVPVDRTCPE
jgi:hypothetical protein